MYLSHSCIHKESPLVEDLYISYSPLPNAAECWCWWIGWATSIFSNLSKRINSVLLFDPGPLTGDKLTEGMWNSAYHSQSWSWLCLLFLWSRPLSRCCQHSCNLCRVSAHPMSYCYHHHLFRRWHKHTDMSSTTYPCVLRPLSFYFLALEVKTVKAFQAKVKERRICEKTIRFLLFVFK